MINLLSEVMTRYFENKQDYEKALKIIEYLKDNGFKNDIIIEILKNADSSYSYQTLPIDLWEGSLIKPNTFYYHPILQLRSEAPVFNSKENSFSMPSYYLEMKIRFTEEDFINYLYNTLHTDTNIRSTQRDIGALHHLLEKHKYITTSSTVLQTLDFLLFLIDCAASIDGHKACYYTLFDVYNFYLSVGMDMLNQKRLTRKKEVITRYGEVLLCGN